jgi:DNA-binding MarR family transcriptional regulator
VGARWLTEEEQEVWRNYLRMSRELLDQLDRELQADAGMPQAYYEVLAALSEAPGRELRMAELALALRSSRSRLSHAVDRLGALGWVVRAACPTDRRGTVARLTDAGYAALEAAAPGHVEGVRRHLFDQLAPDEVRELGRIAERVLSALDATRSPGGNTGPCPDVEACG